MNADELDVWQRLGRTQPPNPEEKTMNNPLVTAVYKRHTRIAPDQCSSHCDHCTLTAFAPPGQPMTVVKHFSGCELARLYEQAGGTVEYRSRAMTVNFQYPQLNPQEAIREHGPETVRMCFPAEVLLTLDNRAQILWPPGVWDVPAKLAGHYYLKACGVEPVTELVQG